MGKKGEVVEEPQTVEETPATTTAEGQENVEDDQENGEEEELEEEGLEEEGDILIENEEDLEGLQEFLEENGLEEEDDLGELLEDEDGEDGDCCEAGKCEEPAAKRAKTETEETVDDEAKTE